MRVLTNFTLKNSTIRVRRGFICSSFPSFPLFPPFPPLYMHTFGNDSSPLQNQDITSPPHTPGPSPRLGPISCPLTPITPLALADSGEKEWNDIQDCSYFFQQDYCNTSLH